MSVRCHPELLPLPCLTHLGDITVVVDADLHGSDWTRTRTRRQGDQDTRTFQENLGCS